MNFRTLDLNLLRVFDAVMHERHVTRAATMLAMSQPAVSNALRRLREAVGEELFVPGPTGVSPTPQAEALWPPVREAMASMRELFDPQRFDPAQDDRTFTLCMADATAAVLMPALVRHVERKGLAVRMRVDALTTRDPRPLLERGGVDAAVGFFPDVMRALAAAAGQADVAHEPLYDCRYVCVMRRGHPLAERPTLSLDDYVGAGHLRVSFAGRPHGFVDEALTELGHERRITMTLSQFSAAAQVLRRSDLLAVFPFSYVAASGLADELAVRELPLPMPTKRVGLLWHRRNARDAAHHWLRSTLVEVARDAVPIDETSDAATA